MAAVRPPVSDGGPPTISTDPEAWVVIEKTAIAAVSGDPVAQECVLGKLLKRVGRARRLRGLIGAARALRARHMANP